MEKAQKKKINRRKFFASAIAAVAGFELLYVLFGLTGKKNAKVKAATMFNAGNIGFFENNKMYPFNSGRFYLSKFEDGGLLAISIKCTHLGCMVQGDAETNGFDCPCHASKFNKYGEVLSPPATRALDIFPIEIRNGEVWVDTQHPIKRQVFDASQLIYA